VVDDISEKKKESIIRDFWDAYDERNVEKMLTFFAEDAVWFSPVGTFKGKEGLRRVLTWDTQIMPTSKSSSSCIGIMVKGNKAVSEGISEGDYEGKKFEEPGITVFVFSNDKIQHIRLFYNKLSMVKQVAMQYTGIIGWFARRIVNYIVKSGEKGLH